MAHLFLRLARKLFLAHYLAHTGAAGAMASAMRYAGATRMAQANEGVCAMSKPDPLDDLRLAATIGAASVEMTEATHIAARIYDVLDASDKLDDVSAKHMSMACAYLAGWWGGGCPGTDDETVKVMALMTRIGVAVSRAQD